MIGLLDPWPGIATFHATFWSSLHSTGGLPHSEDPLQ